ncbi:MAG: imelysin family protein, partial [Pseudomonadota bacterium]
MRSPARTRALTDVLAPTVDRALALALAVALSAGAARAETDHSAAAARVLEGTVLPGTAGFVAATDALVAAAPPACGDVDPAALSARFQETWDAWMAIQHLRFGPIEAESRVLQVAFWPDSRGTVGRTVERIMATENAPVDDPAAFAAISVGGRGLPAIERLLFNDDGPEALEPAFRCAYVAAVAGDLSRLAGEIDAAWQGDFGAAWASAGAEGNAVFLAPAETSQRLFATTVGALEET